MRRMIGLVSLVALTGCNSREADSRSDRAEADQAVIAARAADDGMRVDGDADRSDREGDDAGEFAREAALANIGEIQTSELAVTRASRPEVKSFAQKMVRDHTAALESLRGIAPSYALPDAAGDALQGKMADLRNADADSFDRDYLDMQEEMHERAVGLFEDYAEDGDDASLVQFAQTTLPAIRTHLEEVRALRSGFDMGDDMMGMGTGNASDVNPPAANRNDAAAPRPAPMSPDPLTPDEEPVTPLPTTDPDTIPEPNPQ